jgi:hypothetical protein
MSVFPIAPTEGRYLWFLIPMGLLLLGVMVILVVSLRGGRATRFEIDGSALRLRGDLYGRAIPLSHLRVDQARRVNFAVDSALRPKWRRMGTALPGYSAGWFTLNSGEKALVYLTDRSRAVYIPTSDGYSLLLSPTDPDAFLAQLPRNPR